MQSGSFSARKVESSQRSCPAVHLKRAFSYSEHPGRFQRSFHNGRRKSLRCELCSDGNRKYILQCRSVGSRKYRSILKGPGRQSDRPSVPAMRSSSCIMRFSSRNRPKGADTAPSGVTSTMLAQVNWLWLIDCVVSSLSRRPFVHGRRIPSREHLGTRLVNQSEPLYLTTLQI